MPDRSTWAATLYVSVSRQLLESNQMVLPLVASKLSKKTIKRHGRIYTGSGSKHNPAPTM